MAGAASAKTRPEGDATRSGPMRGRNVVAGRSGRLWYVTRVRFDGEHTLLRSVRVIPDQGSQLGAEQELSRAELIEGLEGGMVVMAITPVAPGRFRRWNRVALVPVGDGVFIRTDPAPAQRDFLGDLPEY